MNLARINRRKVFPIATAALLIVALFGWTRSARADHSLLVSAQVEVDPAGQNASPEVGVDLLEEILQPTPQVAQDAKPPAVTEPALPSFGPPTPIPVDQPPTRSNTTQWQQNTPAPDLQPVRRTRANATGSPTNSPTGPQVKIFSLSEANAFDMAQLIRQLLEGRALRAAADGRTNSLIVVGTSDEIAIIEAIVSQLDRTPARPSKATPASNEAARMKEVPVPQGDRYGDPADVQREVLQMQKLRDRQVQELKEKKALMEEMVQRGRNNSEAGQFRYEPFQREPQAAGDKP